MPRSLRSGNKASVHGGVLLSATPEKAMNEMMETIDMLRDVYVEENKALQSVDTKGFMNLQEKKLETAKLYQKGIEEIVARKDEMRRVDPTLKRRLERMQEDFSAIAAENKEALKRMQRTVERLTDTIRSAAKDAVNQHQATSYGDSGRLQSTEKRVVSTGISETA
jgi:hypothetical protein